MYEHVLPSCGGLSNWQKDDQGKALLIKIKKNLIEFGLYNFNKVDRKQSDIKQKKLNRNKWKW